MSSEESRQVALVTGAGRSQDAHGVGSATAMTLAGRGFSVAVVDIHGAAAGRTVDEIIRHGGHAFPVTADLATWEGCTAATEATLDRGSRLDVLVNNLAVVQPGTVLDISDEQWNRTILVNLTSAFRMSKLAVGHMKLSGGGSIVNITSIAGLRGGGDTVAYAASKAGLIGLTQDMAGSHGVDGIRVNAVAPGYLFTPMVARFADTEAKRRVRRDVVALSTEGTCWDVAELVAFLSANDARWITGAVIPVDAGAQAMQPLGVAARLGMLSGDSNTSSS